MGIGTQVFLPIPSVRTPCLTHLRLPFSKSWAVQWQSPKLHLTTGLLGSVPTATWPVPGEHQLLLGEMSGCLQTRLECEGVTYRGELGLTEEEQLGRRDVLRGLKELQYIEEAC